MPSKNRFIRGPDFFQRLNFSVGPAGKFCQELATLTKSRGWCAVEPCTDIPSTSFLHMRSRKSWKKWLLIWEKQSIVYQTLRLSKPNVSVPKGGNILAKRNTLYRQLWFTALTVHSVPKITVSKPGSQFPSPSVSYPKKK
jgi:hypothetical protein